MLTINHNASCIQVIHVAPVFYLPLVFGKGKNKRILTVNEKCQQITQDLGGLSFVLTRQDKTVSKGGFDVNQTTNISFKKTNEEKIHLKKMKYYFKKDIKVKFPSEKELSHEQLFKKYAQKIIHSNSETWTHS